jgi:hypothetical protein
MSSTDLKSLHIARALAPIAAATVLISLGATPSSARSDLGTRVPTTDHAGACQLLRVGTQFVRCDNLTGNGVAAAAWIPSADSTTPLKSMPAPHAGRRPSLARSRTVQQVTTDSAAGGFASSDEHLQTTVDFATVVVHVAVAGSDRFPLDPDGTLLPGDVRVWELNHPTGATPALLPGDLRHRERNGRADLSAPAA